MTLFLYFTLLFAQATPTTEIPLAIGESHTLSSRPLEMIHIQKKGILSFKDEGGRLIFVGKKIGQTQVSLGQKKYFFQVLPKRRFSSLNNLKEWVKNKRGPKIKVINKFPTVVGRLLTLEDFLELQTHTTELSEFQISAQVSPGLKKEITTFIQSQLIQNNLTPGHLNFSSPWGYSLNKHSKAQVSQYKKILKRFGLAVHVDTQSLNDKPVVKIKLYIAHIKKSFLRQWGVGWPSQLSLQAHPTQGLQIDSFQIALNALETSGQGQILATPTLVTESGHKAEFHSGGEFPIRTTTQFTNNVQWKKHGLFLNVTPKVNARRNLQIAVDLELSTIDQTQADVDVPSINRSHVKTQINLESPRPILLSGLIKQTQSQGRVGLPWLQQIPIFKPLFSNSQIYDDNYELLFILIPSYHD